MLMLPNPEDRGYVTPQPLGLRLRRLISDYLPLSLDVNRDVDTCWEVELLELVHCG